MLTDDAICSPSKSIKPKRELKIAIRNNIKIVLYNNSTYQKSLRNLIDKPLIFYIKGNISKKILNFILIIEKRKNKQLWETVKLEFASHFSKIGISTVLGPARGVNTQTHNYNLQHWKII
ncbi:MAG: hypothetical protein Nk1A_2800 [Endomicrobiia bacterium]|nr:MAG: hypothetical protein Nk1A_2800 [Endomicrobiia bacterium]